MFLYVIILPKNLIKGEEMSDYALVYNEEMNRWEMEDVLSGQMLLSYCPQDPVREGCSSACTFINGKCEQYNFMDRRNTPESAARVDLMIKFFETACQQADRHAVHPYKKVMEPTVQQEKDLVVSLCENLPLDLTGKWGRSILHIAAQYGQTAGLKRLLNRGADPLAKTPFTRRTMWDYLKMWQQRKDKASERVIQERLKAFRKRQKLRATTARHAASAKDRV